MTMQSPEILYIEKKPYEFYDYPLEYYWNKKKERPDFNVPSTACWRGYIARWTIRDKKLYLTSIRGEFYNGNKAEMRKIFNSKERRIFANWFTGKIRVANPGSYIVGGAFTSMCNDLTVFEFKKGILIKEERIKYET